MLGEVTRLFLGGDDLDEFSSLLRWFLRPADKYAQQVRVQLGARQRKPARHEGASVLPQRCSERMKNFVPATCSLDPKHRFPSRRTCTACSAESSVYT